MAYARPFNQPQGASPWSAGVPPGLQQQQQQPAAPHPPAQQMFNQPMGAFDISGAWQGQQQAGQWAQPMQPMQQPVQFVPNPAFMQQPLQRFQQQHQPLQQQRPMHQRSLSAPRIGVNGPNKRNNQNNSFGGGQQNWQQKQHQNNNNQYQQRTTRQQQARQQKVQFSNNNNNNNNNNNSKPQNQNRQQQQQQPQQQQQQQQQKQQQQQQQSKQQQQQAPKKGIVKVTKVVRKQALKVKQGVAKVKPTPTDDKAVDVEQKQSSTDDTADDSSAKPQSKTAERKQLKLQARKNAEALKQAKLPVIKSTKATGKGIAVDARETEAGTDETPIDQAQLKCVPAVFGFVCKLCDVFLRDRFARREHIDSESHMQKFKAFEEEQKQATEANSAPNAEATKLEPLSSDAADEKPSVDEEAKPSEAAPDSEEQNVAKPEVITVEDSANEPADTMNE